MESLLQASGTVLVVAECSDASGNLQLQAPEGRGLFVVRRGTEDDFSRSIRHWRHIWTWSTWSLSAATVLALVWIVR